MQIKTFLTTVADTSVKVEYETEPEFHIHNVVTTHEDRPRFLTKTKELQEALEKKIKEANDGNQTRSA